MSITEHEVTAAQGSWAEAVVAVGRATTWQDAKTLAEQLVEKLYVTEPLFCPTRAAQAQFRRNKKAAVSYFVGQDSDYPEDEGFALEPWDSVRFSNSGIVCRDDVAITMGNYFFTRRDGSELKVEYSFVYVRDAAGTLKIQLHHSALPFGG